MKRIRYFLFREKCERTLTETDEANIQEQNTVLFNCILTVPILEFLLSAFMMQIDRRVVKDSTSETRYFLYNS